MRPEVGFRWLQIGHKSEKWHWRHILATWRHLQMFFDVVLFLFSSLVTGPSFVSIHHWFWSYDSKRLTWNTPVWVLSNIWRLGRVRDTTFRKNVSNEILLNAAKCQCYSFYDFWVIMGKPTPPPRLGLNRVKMR